MGCGAWIWPFLPACPPTQSAPPCPLLGDPGDVMFLFQSLPHTWNSDWPLLLTRAPCLVGPNLPFSKCLYTETVSLPEFSVVSCSFDLQPNCQPQSPPRLRGSPQTRLGSGNTGTPRARTPYFKETRLGTSIPFRDSRQRLLPPPSCGEEHVLPHALSHLLLQDPLSGCHCCHFPDGNTVARELQEAARAAVRQMQRWACGEGGPFSQGGGRQNSPFRQPPHSPQLIINTRTPALERKPDPDLCVLQ